MGTIAPSPMPRAKMFAQRARKSKSAARTASSAPCFINRSPKSSLRRRTAKPPVSYLTSKTAAH